MVGSVVVRQGQVEVRGQLDAGQVESCDLILGIQVRNFESRIRRRRIPIITAIRHVVIWIWHVARLSENWVRTVRSERSKGELLSIEPHVDFLVIGSDLNSDVGATLVGVQLGIEEGPIGWGRVLGADWGEDSLQESQAS